MSLSPVAQRDIVRMPAFPVERHSLEYGLGFRSESHIHSHLLASKAYEVKKKAKEHSLEIIPVGFDEPPHQPRWVLGEDGKNDFVMIQAKDDQLLQEADFFFRPDVYRKLRKIEKLEIFDDFWVAHEVVHDPKRTINSVVPWEDLKSQQQKNFVQAIAETAKIETILQKGASNLASNYAKLLLLILVAIGTVIAIAAVLLVMAAILVIIVPIVASLALLFVLSLFLASPVAETTGLDPIVYGIVYDEYGQMAAAYKLAEWVTK